MQQGNKRSTDHVPLPDGRIVSTTQLSRELGLPDGKLLHVVGSAKKSTARGATTPAEQALKVGIQFTRWMLDAGLL
jgi:hypothetical protein